MNQTDVDLSVVIPVHNEAENVLPLAGEIAAALSGTRWEALFVDDGSTDETAARVRDAREKYGPIRLLRHARCAGQSTAITTGVRHARATWIATLDGDGQNDPADIPALLTEVRNLPADSPVKLIGGHRVNRKDTWLKRVSSRVANAVRGFLLKDNTPDTGCGLKVFERDTFMKLPYFDHMHRFLPCLVQQSGFQTRSVPVNHRPRLKGKSKYGLSNRLWVGIVDLFGVAWLGRRNRRPVDVDED